MTMAEYKRDFIEFAIFEDVLKFGNFTLKSGRNSPYFFNVGEFNSGEALQRLGGYYAAALIESAIHVDCLFGPAYKGIPLVSATAITLAIEYGIDLPYAFNRKELKDHGEGGTLIGAPLVGDVVMIDDVITAGTAIREAITIIEQNAARVVGVMVAIDRQERGGQGEISAIQEMEREYGLSVINVVNLDNIVEYLASTGSYQRELEAIDSYRNKFGNNSTS